MRVSEKSWAAVGEDELGVEAAAVIQVSDAGGLDSGRGGGTLGGESTALGNELMGLGKEGRQCFYFA